MKFIVLGAAGRMGSLHAKHLREMGHEVTGVDPNDSELPRRALMHDWHNLRPDGIVIATPAEQHAADINTVLAAGHVKHIFVEKPICLIKQLPGMRKMALDAHMNSVTIHVGYNLRFNRGVRELMEKKIRHMARVFILRQVPQRPCKHFLEEWASHEIDLALYMSKPAISKVVSMRWDCGKLDFNCAIRQQDGVHSFVHVDGHHSPNVRSIMIMDDRGDVWTRDIEGTVTDGDYKLEIQAWTDVITNRGDTILADAVAGIAAIDAFNSDNKL